MTMNHYLAIFSASAALLLCLPSQAQYRNDFPELGESETVKAMREHVTMVSSASMEGRAPGSEGESRTADYVAEVLKNCGVDVLENSGMSFGIVSEGGDTLKSRNVVGLVQGYDPALRDHYIVVGARMDNLGVNELTVNGVKEKQIYYGANGNASGLALMLELARRVSTNSILFRRSVIFIGFGASTRSYAGAWYFLNRSFSDVDKIDAMVNLDMVGTGSDSFTAYTSSNADMNSIINSMVTSLEPVYPKISAQEPYPSDHRAFYSKKIPSVMFTTGRYPEHDTWKDTGSIIDYEGMEAELEYVYNFLRTLANTSATPLFNPMDIKPDTDNHVYGYYDTDQRAEFMGRGDPKYFLVKWVYLYLKYPKEAVDEGIQGRVLVQFIIGKDGGVEDAKVTRSADPLLDEEALRVVKASPKWKPAKVKGKPVKVAVTIPVEFRLEKKGSGKIKIN